MRDRPRGNVVDLRPGQRDMIMVDRRELQEMRDRMLLVGVEANTVALRLGQILEGLKDKDD